MNHPMKPYVCHQRITAAKIIDILYKPREGVNPEVFIKLEDGGDGSMWMPRPDWVARYNPQIGGYVVKNGEGHFCYSSAETFEHGYTSLEDMVKSATTTPPYGTQPDMASIEHPRPILINYHRIEGNIVNEGINLRAVGEAGPGGAHLEYEIEIPTNSGTRNVTNLTRHLVIRFHVGNPVEEGVKGLTNEVILAMLIHRMEGFEKGKFFCYDDNEALIHLKQAMIYFHNRSAKRQARGVEGKLIA